MYITNKHYDDTQYTYIIILYIYKKKKIFSPFVNNFFLVLARGVSSNRQDESPSQGLSLNRSQRGNCSTEYNTPPGT